MGNSDSETINEDKATKSTTKLAVDSGGSTKVPKRPKDSTGKLIKKRYRTELSTDDVPTSPPYEEDSKMPWGWTWQQSMTGAQSALQQPSTSDISLLPQSSLSSVSVPVVSILGRNRYADQTDMYGHSLFNQMQTASTAGSARGGTSFAESLLSGLSPATRHFLLRDQIARNQHAAMLVAQMPYDTRLQAAALNERFPTSELLRQNLPASDMIARYASVLSGLQSSDQAEHWRGTPGGVGLADQFRLHQLNQLSQQQPLGLMSQRQQLLRYQQHQSDQLRIEDQHRIEEQRQRFEHHRMSGSPQSQSTRTTDKREDDTIVARRVQRSPPSSFSTRSTEPKHIGRDRVVDGIQSEQRLELAAASTFIPRRLKRIVNEDIELPPCTEGTIPPLKSRRTFPLGIDEDTNWLSEFHCFVREELIEVFQASHDDVKTRNTAITYNQIGLRCRYCAHMTGSARAGRSSAFPSSIRQIYQSFTMMLRDHFPNCEAITGDVGNRYTMLKDKPSQGATDSKRYWIYSGLKIGMADSKQGIFMTRETRREGLASLPFGLDPNNPWRDDAFAHVSLVSPSDRETITEFLVLLVSQVQPIRLTETECIGNRRSLRVGLPGFGCRYCCQQRRLGLCRMFPARRRTLPTKLFDFYDHIRRCPLCPSSVQVELISKKCLFDEKPAVDQGADREFFDRVWTLLGHDTSQGT